MEPTNETYTLKQACAVLGKSQSFLWRLVAQGKIQRITPPNTSHGRYLKSEIDALAQSMREFERKYPLAQ